MNGWQRFSQTIPRWVRKRVHPRWKFWRREMQLVAAPVTFSCYVKGAGPVIAAVDHRHGALMVNLPPADLFAPQVEGDWL